MRAVAGPSELSFGLSGGPTVASPADSLGTWMDDRPIGVFDSGFGGLTVARALIDLLPGEDLVYLGDTGRYPYGPRPLDQVRNFSHQITQKLVAEDGVKMVVIACNTASAAALDLLRFDFDVPLVGVIDPGLRAAIRATRTGRIGVIGTVGTIASGAYQRAALSMARTVAGRPAVLASCPGPVPPSCPGPVPASGPVAPRSVPGRAGLELTCSACPGFVEFVERGETSSDQVYVLAERLLAPVRAAGVDTLLLGCTHYPFLARTISDVVGREVVLVSSADETAFEVRSILADTGLGRRSTQLGQHRWISSGDTEVFGRLGRRLFGPEIDKVERWDPSC